MTKYCHDIHIPNKNMCHYKQCCKYSCNLQQDTLFSFNDSGYNFYGPKICFIVQHSFLKTVHNLRIIIIIIIITDAFWLHTLCLMMLISFGILLPY